MCSFVRTSITKHRRLSDRKEINLLTILEAGSPRSMCLQGLFFSEGSLLVLWMVIFSLYLQLAFPL